MSIWHSKGHHTPLAICPVLNIARPRRANQSGLHRPFRLSIGGRCCLLPLAMLLAVPAKAATITAKTCSQSDVRSAVNSAARGDTVTVPTGSCIWSSTLNLTKGITLAGAGVSSTAITASGGIVLVAVNPDSTAIANSENIEVSGFSLDGANSSTVLMTLQGASGITDIKPYRYVIIANNKFQNLSPSGTGCIEAPGNGNGQIRGVIYNNTFDRCNEPMRLFSSNDTREWANTAFNQFSYGSADNLYFENNTILFSSSYSGSNPGWIETGQGARLVARYNSWNLANSTPQEIWDIHGFQNWNNTVDSGQTGTMLVEYYGNTLMNMGNYRWVHHRGSWGLYFDNILSGSGGNSFEIDQVQTGCPDYINPTPTNYTPQTNNTYAFNNTQNGIAKVAVTGPYGDNCDGGQNVGWWTEDVSCTASACSAGIGRGMTPPTGTCTTGVGFWVSATPTPTVSSSGIQNGSFYKCTATNTWTIYYKPYTYPHPLISGMPPPPATCDVNKDGTTNVSDVQLEVNMALGVASCTNDLNGDGTCNVIDVQRIVNAALGGQCVTGP